MFTFKQALLGAALLLGPTAGFAQQLPPAVAEASVPPAAPLYDPQQLPAYRGQVQLFTLTPRGDIDGFVLSDGTEVKTPPHLSTQVAAALRPGDMVTIHGLKAASLPLIQASSVTSEASGRRVVDAGPEGQGRRHEPPTPPPPVGTDRDHTLQQGRVRMALHGPRGDINGAVLEDGTILRLPPDFEAAAMLQPGQIIFFSGAPNSSFLGTVVEATAIGTNPSQMTLTGREGPRRPERPLPRPPV